MKKHFCTLIQTGLLVLILSLGSGFPTLGEEAISQTLRATDTPIDQLRVALPGSFVTYGVYEQDNVKKNGMEPIEWRVLENTGDSLLLMSHYVLDGVPYSNAYDTYEYNPLPVTWETCSLRSWLNSTFYMTAFDSVEQSRIMTVLNSNTPSNDVRSYYGDTSVNHGNDTFDRVFILSKDECNKYFPCDAVYLNCYGGEVPYSTALRIKATPYALKHGASEWTMRDVDIVETNHSYVYNIRYDMLGYADLITLRTLAGSNTNAYNIGCEGTSTGMRTVTYDMCECPVIRINTK